MTLPLSVQGYTEPKRIIISMMVKIHKSRQRPVSYSSYSGALPAKGSRNASREYLWMPFGPAFDYETIETGPDGSGVSLLKKHVSQKLLKQSLLIHENCCGYPLCR